MAARARLFKNDSNLFLTQIGNEASTSNGFSRFNKTGLEFKRKEATYELFGKNSVTDLHTMQNIKNSDLEPTLKKIGDAKTMTGFQGVLRSVSDMQQVKQRKELLYITEKNKRLIKALNHMSYQK